MSKKYIEINLSNKTNNSYDKKIKEKLFSLDINSNISRLLNKMILKELLHYKPIINNNITLTSANGNRQLKLSTGNFHFNSVNFNHSFIYFNDINENIADVEIQYIITKLKLYFEEYLNYEINMPIVFIDNRL